MSDRKLILPTELKVCATCTSWDGKREIDDEMRVVVVCQSCEGECLVSESLMSALAKGVPECDCLWEDIQPDEVSLDHAEPADGTTGKP